MKIETERTAEELERQIAELPIGYISKKMIHGKPYYYQQWTENGKTRSICMKKEEAEELKVLIEKRKSLQKQLKGLKRISTRQAEVRMPEVDLETNTLYGRQLLDMAQMAEGLEVRDCFSTVQSYLDGKTGDKVCLILGLRRTGKTTLFRQAVLHMTRQQQARTVYIRLTARDTIESLNRDLKKLGRAGYRCILIDEITLLPDFLHSATLFSDIYAAQGMKIVLSGAHSLGLWFALQKLYDRAVVARTTFIPYREHSRLLKIDSVDEYIRHGGTLYDAMPHDEAGGEGVETASFRGAESTRHYIDNAVCQNIVHSLSDGGAGQAKNLPAMPDAAELSCAIYRVIEEMNEEFAMRVVKASLKTHRLESMAAVPGREKLPAGYTEEHIAEIKQYLTALDLIAPCPTESLAAEPKIAETMLFTQPGMRYCQAQALIHRLVRSKWSEDLSERERKLLGDRILEEIREQMLRDLVLLETARTANKGKRAFRLRFAESEFDMVIYHEETNTCELYAVRYSDMQVPTQYRDLTEPEKTEQTRRRFGAITKRCVLYRGTNDVTDEGITYQNVEEYLSALPH
ncbi:MAG: AAA family ATPase [Lachnospiraceae bacterium]|nr:AAA family ATPase [Lachnospiraceae bacterium]